MSEMRKITPQYNLESLKDNTYTGELKMITELLEHNYPNWVYMPESNSLAYEVGNYILKSEVVDALKNLEDYGVDATIEELIEILKTK